VHSDTRALENPGRNWRDIVLALKQEVDLQGCIEKVPVDFFSACFKGISRHFLIAGLTRRESSEII
jgi:hypothetical protein